MINRKIYDMIFRTFLWFAALSTLGILVFLVVYIIVNGIGAISWGFLFTDQKSEFQGIFPIIISTLWIVLLGIAFSAPIGVFGAIYLVEYAKPGKLVRTIRFATESLSGIPSIVFGLFGLIVFVTMLQLRYSIIAGAITVSIMVLPTIIRTVEETLISIPRSYREGSFALGASKFQTISKVILPPAIPGILTSVILSIGRIVGESAAVFLTAGMVARMPESIKDQGRTLAVHMYVLAKEGISFEKAYGTAAVLIILVGVINLTANRIAKRIKSR